MRITLIAHDGVFDTGYTATLDALRLANGFAAREGRQPPFEISVVGVRKKVRTHGGLVIPVQPITSALTPDWVVLPALATSTPELLIPALERPDVKQAVVELRRWHEQGAKIATSCIGAFVFAETGLLDDRDATTTWWLAPLFRQRFPKVRLDESRMLVPTDIGVTAGAAMGHLDLALWLIRKASPELAVMVSRYLLADLRSSQAQYIIPNHLAQADPLVLRFERWARDHLKDGFSLQDAASAVGTSTRSLQRRCQAILGKSPLSYFQDLRVEHAQALLHGGMDLEAVAAQVGYVDGATLGALLRQRTGRGVRDLRADLR
ncbi:AraC family transcriptional regulator [Burkholderia lata]|uniref:GlxA family transcriptional regulator n=1 Tax=Burkholderia lata (strain ATCC 17760 / DSM 23089 / LMG 22485 / NCIMB 9086 / R18194 / 383) TaxID=482957 RepID=UPI0008417DB8|nr:helix-turn-helix domain-containing protein [Burkholderia lata]AOJ41473.1 AraC family transcriptional regulator [Burkholderia lata]